MMMIHMATATTTDDDDTDAAAAAGFSSCLTELFLAEITPSWAEFPKGKPLWIAEADSFAVN